MRPEGTTAAALALHQHPGRYCLLLGSGLSSTAGILTGWGITIDLIGQWALAEGEHEACDPNPERWYVEKTGNQPDYSDLLEMLAPTTDERQSILRGYFEPGSAEERDEGQRVATAAHRSIARLAAGGAVKVIITTNFDRLLEEALAAEGLQPNVVASDDAVKGMVPLNHGELTIVKVHGDYRSTDLRNTPDELAEYPEALGGLLDEVLERYGLIVCGWSGDWDAALRASIVRSTRHRYQTFWMARGDLSEKAEALIAHRQATVIPIESANAAFTALADKVEVLNDGRESDPLSPELALRAAKKYVADPVYRVKLHELLWHEAEAIRGATSPTAMPWSSSADQDAWRTRLERMEAACARLAPMVAAVAYYGSDSQQAIIRRVVQRLLTYDDVTGQFSSTLESASRYPAAIVAYSAGIASLMSEGCMHWARLLASNVQRHRYEDEKPLAGLIASMSVLNGHRMQPIVKTKPSDPDRHTPSSDWMIARLWLMLQPVLPDEGAFIAAFDEWELFIALDCASRGRSVPSGGFTWRYERDRHTALKENRLLRKIKLESEAGEQSHPAVRVGMFQGDQQRMNEALEWVAEHLVDRFP